MMLLVATVGSMVSAAPVGHVDVLSMVQCCHQRSCRGLRSVVRAAARGRVGVYNPCCCQLLWARKLLWLWYYQWVQIHKLRMRNIKGIFDSPRPKETIQVVQMGSF